MKLFLFTSDLKLAKMAAQASIDSIMLDWERKTAASAAADGTVDTPQDLERLTSELDISVSVRINGTAESLQEEIDMACKFGVQHIMLPMARHENDIKKFVEIVDNRAQTIIQIETCEILGRLDKIRELPWDHAYIGMLDLASSRGDDSIWSLLHDHTIEKIVNSLDGRSVGFGGITVVDGGSPVPFTMLLHEMTRLGSTLGFMRRSFKREIKGRVFNSEIDAIRSLIKASRARSQSAVADDHTAFMEYLSKLI